MSETGLAQGEKLTCGSCGRLMKKGKKRRDIEEGKARVN